jgi:uncharacterized membrane protein YvlD (DUF360 family)
VTPNHHLRVIRAHLAPPYGHPMLAGRLWRLLAILVIDGVALLVLSAALRGFAVAGAGAAIGLAVVMGAANAVVWPLLIRVALPFTVLTLGFGALILNGAVLLGIAALSDRVTLDGLGDALVVVLGLTALTTAIGGVLALDRGDVWTRQVIRRQLRRTRLAAAGDVPGVVFLEIDGLSHDVMRRALRDGNAPALARWLADGTHRLEGWETDWSSQTGACQAGLLHGDNHDMPAFRWWEKDRGAAMVTNHPRDAAEIERRRSDGRGLLHADGASRANILSGDAPHSMLTMSTVLDRGRAGRLGQDYFAYFASPYGVARTMLNVLGDVAGERWAAVQQRRRDVRPRVHRGFSYALVRAYATVIQLDLQVAAVTADVLAGRPVVYTTFLAYDEVAHHSGVERPDTLAVLRRVDRAIARIAAALPHAARPYELVVLSDHGQSQGATFLQRYGETLEDVVRRHGSATDEVRGEQAHSDEGLASLSAGLTELAGRDGAAGRVTRAATRGRSVGGEVQLARAEDADADADLPEISVMASGNLGLVSFPREPGRVTLEALAERRPGLVAALAGHPGVGFVLVRSERDGPVALGAAGRHLLRDGVVEGEDPLAPFGPRAPLHVLRTDAFPHCPDLLVQGRYWPELEEVAAFEELVGSHGGLGGGQSHPFVLFPRALAWPAEEVVGSATLHRVLRGWLAGLGQAAYAPAPSSQAAPGSSTTTRVSGASPAA